MNSQCSLPPSIPWLSWDPWARHRTPNCSPAPQQYVCVHCCVCALGWVKCRAQIPSMGHHIWPHVTSLHFTFTKFVYVWLRKSFYSRLLSEWGQIKAGFFWKVKTQGWISTHCSWSSCTSRRRSKSHTYFTQYFYDYLRIAFALPQKRGAGWAEFISM